jgi:hypothetical protein
MRRLVRNPNTGEYLAVMGGWTQEAALTANFDGLNEALGRCRELNLKDVEYVLRFDFGQSDIVVPILSRQSEAYAFAS